MQAGVMVGANQRFTLHPAPFLCTEPESAEPQRSGGQRRNQAQYESLSWTQAACQPAFWKFWIVDPHMPRI